MPLYNKGIHIDRYKIPHKPVNAVTQSHTTAFYDNVAWCICPQRAGSASNAVWVICLLPHGPRQYSPAYIILVCEAPGTIGYFACWMTGTHTWNKDHKDHKTKDLVSSLMISQHWFREWLGAIRQQAITRANVDPDLCHQMASLGLNELTHWVLWWLAKYHLPFA